MIAEIIISIVAVCNVALVSYAIFGYLIIKKLEREKDMENNNIIKSPYTPEGLLNELELRIMRGDEIDA